MYICAKRFAWVPKKAWAIVRNENGGGVVDLKLEEVVNSGADGRCGNERQDAESVWYRAIEKGVREKGKKKGRAT